MLGYRRGFDFIFNNGLRSNESKSGKMDIPTIDKFMEIHSDSGCKLLD